MEEPKSQGIPTDTKPAPSSAPSVVAGKARAAVDATVAKLRLWQEAASFSVIAFATTVGVLALGWVYFTNPGWNESAGFFRRPSPAAEAMPEPQPAMVRRAIDGTLVPEGSPEPDYVAVMIDNIAEALPHYGVSAAPLVFEAPVEGGITRLMAVFPSDAVFEQLGPVRSARPYYVDWAEEFGALYVHVGGSPEALEKLRASDLRDLNEFFAGKFFWRDGKRRAPHNTFVSSETLGEALVKRARTADALSPWKYKEEALMADRPADTFETVIGEQGKWRVRWRYDRESNSYARIISSGPDKDAGGTPVLAKQVLIQFTEVRVLDEVGRRRVDTRSGGDATILMDGRSIGGTWKFDKSTGRTRFHDAAGNELSLNAGVTWVEVVPEGTPVMK